MGARKLGMAILVLIGLITASFVIAEIKDGLDMGNADAAPLEGNTLYVGGSGANNYTKIQDAINASSPEDTILVYPGTYIENVDINKDHLAIKSVKGADSTIVQAANPNDYVFEVSENYVNIRGFTVKGATRDQRTGIYLNIVSYCNISDNNVLNNQHGIVLSQSGHNNISSNIVLDNYAGIILYSSSYNNISNNSVSNNSGYGILLYFESEHNDVLNNIVSNNYDGISLYSQSSVGNIISKNTVMKNNYGLWLYWTGNKVYHNNFINNQVQAIDHWYPDVPHIFDDGYPSGGNYWSDYAGVDEKSGPNQDQPGADGIGDSSRLFPGFPGGRDDYPLMEPFENYSYSDQSPVCEIVLQKNGKPINNVMVGEFFDIYVGGSTDDKGIVAVRFSSDNSQDGVPNGEWTTWCGWNNSSGNWNADGKIMNWSFSSRGDKEVWAEVKDTANQINKSNANIHAGIDTDGDGLTDWEEINKYHTDPNNPDTDGDGVNDYEEVKEYGTNATKADSDDDGIGDSVEINLAEKYRPIVYLSVGELFYPMQVENFLKYSKLKDGEEIDPPVTGNDLKSHSGDEYYLDLYKNSNQNAEDVKNYKDALNLWNKICQNNNHKNTTYVNVEPINYCSALPGSNPVPCASVPSGYAIQYWFLYLYNHWPVDGKYEGWDDHEGDWEHITVFLDEHKKPFRVVYGRHGWLYDGEDWNDVNLAGRPQLYPAKGGHASYPKSGTTKLPYPPFMTPQLFSSDYHEGGKKITDLQIKMVEKQNWTYFKGKWGEQHGHLAAQTQFGADTWGELKKSYGIIGKLFSPAYLPSCFLQHTSMQ